MSKPTAPTEQPQAQAPAPARARVRGVYGRMQNPVTLDWIEQSQDGKKVEIDWWIKIQLDAGKLAIVTD